MSGRTFYRLTPGGAALAYAVASSYAGLGAVSLDYSLRHAWRPAMVSSPYVRAQWLKYFMPTLNFAFEDFLQTGSAVTIIRASKEERFSKEFNDVGDSGYCILSKHWDDKPLNDLERREIYEGLRRWTDAVYLTDYHLPTDVEEPFLYQTEPHVDTSPALEWHPVKAWFNPVTDIDAFAALVGELVSSTAGARITIPDLIIQVSQEKHYAKRDIANMLVELFYYTDEFFFERGSEFLIDRAFDVAKSKDYYVQIEGVWRTGLMRR